MELNYQYREGTSYIHRLDPITKFVGMLCLSLMVFGTFIWWIQVLILFACLFVALIGAQQTAGNIWRSTRLFAVLCVVFFIVQLFLLHGDVGHVLFTFAGHPFYSGLVSYSAAVSLRIYSVFLISLIFIRTTHPRDFAIGMAQVLKVPYRYPYSLFIAMRTVPLVEEELRTIQEAHMVRGVGKQDGLAGRIKNLKRLTVPLMVRALRQAATTALSMECRGFGAYADRTYVDKVEISRSGRWIMGIMITVVIVWYVLIFTGVLAFNYSIT